MKIAKIRNPAAFSAWLARKQMAEIQQQQVNTYQQQGVNGITDQQLTQALLQQSAMKQAQSIRKKEMPLGVYNELFSGATPIPGFSKRRAAYQDLNLLGDDGRA